MGTVFIPYPRGTVLGGGDNIMPDDPIGFAVELVAAGLILWVGFFVMLPELISAL